MTIIQDDLNADDAGRICILKLFVLVMGPDRRYNMGYPIRMGGGKMIPGMTSAEQNLVLLESLIPKNERLYIWCLSREGALIASSCPEELQKIMVEALRKLGVLDRALRRASEAKDFSPRILGSSIGMQWAVTLEKERDRSLVFLIGPVFYTPPDERHLLRDLHAKDAPAFDPSWVRELADALSSVPVLPYAVFSRYVLMVHNTLTGEQLGLEVFSGQEDGSGVTYQTAGERNRIKVYQTEQALLEMVRSGNINYQRAFQNSAAISPGVPVHGRDPLRQMKTSIIVFTTLVCRAAMEGGLSPEIAYPLGDSYIQTAEDCRDSGELSALANAMYHDFIYRVHYALANPNYSHAIQKCCDYIELSLDRRIRTADLAALVGYTEYYLTEKFKKETGKSITSYIRDAKIDRAKILLQTTELSVAAISEQLAFNTPNYFIQSFRNVLGCTPAQYRKQIQSSRV